MKEKLKNILKKSGLYYTVQGRYRNAIFQWHVLINRVKYFKHKGAGYICNFCGYKYKNFAPRHSSNEDLPALKKYNVIAGEGENVYCPYCASTCRERLILQVLKEEIDYKDKNILHLSPEKNIFNFLKNQANVITADIEPGFYKLIDKKVVYADATALPFANDSFDIVIANHIMEHIPKDILAMKEIYRVLKSGGRAILQIPFSLTIPATIEESFISNPQKQSELFGQKDHVRIYNIKNYLCRLSASGFLVKYIEPEKLIAWRKFAVQIDEGFIDCRKS